MTTEQSGEESTGGDQQNDPLFHRAEEFTSRHFGTTVEVYCDVVDETKVIIGREYVRNCPMCGEKIEVKRNG